MTLKDPGPGHIGSRLRRRLSRWETTVGPRSWATRVVREGLKIPLLKAPPRRRCRREVVDPDQRAVLRREIAEMLAVGAVSRCHDSDVRFESMLFCVGKRGGGWRPCLDLRPLNQYVLAPRFSLGGLREVRPLMRQGDFMVSVDLKSAYWHVPLHSSMRRLLGFRFDGKLYRFEVLPFGLSAAPWVFHSLMAPVITRLRAEGVRVCSYLDDLLIFGRSAEECQAAGQRVADLLWDLGFLLHAEKSALTPSRSCVYLGFVLRSDDLTVHLPAEKVRRTARECRRVANVVQFKQARVSVRDLACLLGRLASSADAVAEVRLRSSALERDRAQALRSGRGWSSLVDLSPDSVSELRWWARNLHQVSGRLLRLPVPDVIIRTDASALGWGAVVQETSRFPELRGWQATGRLPPALRSAVSNETELFGLSQAVRALARAAPLKGAHVRVQTDSTTALYYVNQGAGRSQAMSALARPLWLAVRRAGIVLSAEHLSGSRNVTADALSRRRLSSADWVLRSHVFRLLDRIYGPMTLDAFAEPHNAQLRRFACRYPLPGAVRRSGLWADFRQERVYAFPPPSLIPVLLHRLLDLRAQALVVVPVRRDAVWWPLWTKYRRRERFLRDAVVPYLRAPRFKQPLLQAAIFCGWLQD